MNKLFDRLLQIYFWLIPILFLLSTVAAKGQTLTMERAWCSRAMPQTVVDTFTIDGEVFVYGSIYGMPQRIEIPLSDSTAYEVKLFQTVATRWDSETSIAEFMFTSVCGCEFTIILYYQGNYAADAYWELWDPENQVFFNGGNQVLKNFIR